jgi:Domain of unknown function (DUF4395)
MSKLIGFPNPVNEKAARVVAGGVLLLGIATLASGWTWLLAVLAVGFWLRVAAGPRFSPLGQLATKAIAPRLGPPKLVPGPPKRFAQTIGAVLTTTGAVLALGFGLDGAATVLTALLVVAAGLESLLGVCVGCLLFGALMRAGVVPETVCAECADLSLRRARA